jgi:hypothetical protein
MDRASWLLGAAKSKLQDAYQQHLQPLTQPLAQQQPHQHRRSSGQGMGPGQAIQATGAQSVDARVAKFKRELLAETIDLAGLKRMACHGIPDKDGLRAITWKVRAPGRQVPATKQLAPASSARHGESCPPAAAAGLPAAGHGVLGAEAGRQQEAV